jgi:hypothetical protein
MQRKHEKAKKSRVDKAIHVALRADCDFGRLDPSKHFLQIFLERQMEAASDLSWFIFFGALMELVKNFQNLQS